MPRGGESYLAAHEMKVVVSWYPEVLSRAPQLGFREMKTDEPPSERGGEATREIPDRSLNLRLRRFHPTGRFSQQLFPPAERCNVPAMLLQPNADNAQVPSKKRGRPASKSGASPQAKEQRGNTDAPASRAQASRGQQLSRAALGDVHETAAAEAAPVTKTAQAPKALAPLVKRPSREALLQAHKQSFGMPASRFRTLPARGAAAAISTPTTAAVTTPTTAAAATKVTSVMNATAAAQAAAAMATAAVSKAAVDGLAKAAALEVAAPVAAAAAASIETATGEAAAAAEAPVAVSAAADGASRRDAAGWPLPAAYSELLETYDKLQLTLSFFASRSLPAHFNALQRPLEDATRRRVTPATIEALMGAWPAGLVVSVVPARVMPSMADPRALPSGRSTTHDWLVALPPPSTGAALGRAAANQRRKAELRDVLVGLTRDAHAAWLYERAVAEKGVVAADEAAAAEAAAAEAAGGWAAGFPLDECALPPPATLPPLHEVEPATAAAPSQAGAAPRAAGEGQAQAPVPAGPVPAELAGLSASLVAKVRQKEAARRKEEEQAPAAKRSFQLLHLPRLALAVRNCLHTEKARDGKGGKLTRGVMPLPDLMCARASHASLCTARTSRPSTRHSPRPAIRLPRRRRLRQDERCFFSAEELAELISLLTEVAPAWFSTLPSSGAQLFKMDSTRDFSEALKALKAAK